MTPLVVALAVLAAEGDQVGGIDIGVLAQYGVLGIFAALLVWFARGAHQRERDRADRLEEKNNQLHDLMQERVIPALTSATHTVEECTALLTAMQREREAMRLLDQVRAPRRATDEPA